MDKECLLSFSSVSHPISTKILYEKPSPHIYEYACLLQHSNRCEMEWHLAMHVCRAEGELSYWTIPNERDYSCFPNHSFVNIHYEVDGMVA
jgi:hypothetical protein